MTKKVTRRFTMNCACVFCCKNGLKSIWSNLMKHYIFLLSLISSFLLGLLVCCNIYNPSLNLFLVLLLSISVVNSILIISILIEYIIKPLFMRCNVVKFVKKLISIRVLHRIGDADSARHDVDE